MQITKINAETNFRAVNQKYLKRAQREFSYRKGITGDLLECLRFDVAFKDISIQDGLDTLEAIRPYAENAILALEHIKEGFLRRQKLGK